MIVLEKKFRILKIFGICFLCFSNFFQTFLKAHAINIVKLKFNFHALLEVANDHDSKSRSYSNRSRVKHDEKSLMIQLKIKHIGNLDSRLCRPLLNVSFILGIIFNLLLYENKILL